MIIILATLFDEPGNEVAVMADLNFENLDTTVKTSLHSQSLTTSLHVLTVYKHEA